MSVCAQMASARLAKHDLQAKLLTAFAATSHFNPNDKSFPSVGVVLPMPTADPVLTASAAARPGKPLSLLGSRTGNHSPKTLPGPPAGYRRRPARETPT